MPLSLYDLLLRGQGQLGGLGGAGGAGLGGGTPYGTPPFVPNPQSDGSLGQIDPGVDPTASAPMGGFTPEQQAAARRQGLLSFGASLLANSGYQPGPGITGGQALGQALQAYQGAQQGSLDSALQQELLRAKIADFKNPNRGADPALVAEYNFAKQNGFAGSFEEYIKLKQGPVQKPSALQELEALQGYTPEQRELYFRVKRAQETPFKQTDQAGATGAFDARTGGFTPSVTAQQNQDAAAALKAAEAGAATGGKIDAERAATFQQDLNVIDDEILRTERLLTEFKEGKYQTGPLLGGIASTFTTSGQNLKRETGKDVLKGISSATFGALSEGERKFIKELGINPEANEESNIALLEERKAALQKAKQRLIARPPVVQQSGTKAAAKDYSQTSDADLLKEIGL